MAVPHLGLVKYNGEGFTNYLDTMDIAQFLLLNMLTDEVLRGLAQSVLQEWLYFSVIDEFAQACDLPIDLNDLVQQSQTETSTLNSAPLNKYLAGVEAFKRRSILSALSQTQGTEPLVTQLETAPFTRNFLHWAEVLGIAAG